MQAGNVLYYLSVGMKVIHVKHCGNLLICDAKYFINMPFF